MLNFSEKHEVHIIMVVASTMGDCDIDLHWIDLQLCHEDEHIHCNLEGNFKEKEFLRQPKTISIYKGCRLPVTFCDSLYSINI